MSLIIEIAVVGSIVSALASIGSALLAKRYGNSNNVALQAREVQVLFVKNRANEDILEDTVLGNINRLFRPRLSKENSDSRAVIDRDALLKFYAQHLSGKMKPEQMITSHVSYFMPFQDYQTRSDFVHQRYKIVRQLMMSDLPHKIDKPRKENVLEFNELKSNLGFANRKHA
jgi:hypothetical protein